MRLSIVLAINSIYTKSVKFRHRSAYRLSIIGPIVTVSRLYFMSVYSTICTKYIVIAYKNSYKQLLYFGLPVFCREAAGKNNCSASGLNQQPH